MRIMNLVILAVLLLLISGCGSKTEYDEIEIPECVLIQVGTSETGNEQNTLTVDYSIIYEDNQLLEVYDLSHSYIPSASGYKKFEIDSSEYVEITTESLPLEIVTPNELYKHVVDKTFQNKMLGGPVYSDEKVTIKLNTNFDDNKRFKITFHEGTYEGMIFDVYNVCGFSEQEIE